MICNHMPKKNTAFLADGYGARRKHHELVGLMIVPGLELEFTDGSGAFVNHRPSVSSRGRSLIKNWNMINRERQGVKTGGDVGETSCKVPDGGIANLN